MSRVTCRQRYIHRLLMSLLLVVLASGVQGQDAVCPERLGRIPIVQPVGIQGLELSPRGLIYAAVWAEGLFVFDPLTSARNPQQVAAYTPREPELFRPWAMAVGRDGHVFVADRDRGLMVFDNHGGDLRLQGVLSLPAEPAHRISTRGDLVFLAYGTTPDVSCFDREYRFGVFDVSDPRAPRLRGSYDIPQNPRECASFDLAVVGDYVLMAARSQGLKILDVADPDRLQVVGSYMPSDGEVRDIEIARDHALLLTTKAIEVLDLSRPAQPQPVATIPFTGAHQLTVDGSFVYLVDEEQKFHVLNLTDWHTPIFVGTGEKATGPVVTRGGFAAVPNRPDRGLDFYGLCGCESLCTAVCGERLSSTDLRRGRGLAIDREHVFVVGQGLHVFEVSDPRQPREIATVPQVSGTDVVVQNGYAYVAQTSSRGGLHVIDVSNPATPAPVAYLGPSGYHAVTVRNDYAYLGGQGTGLRVVDVSDPTNPELRGSVGDAWLQDVAVQGAYAYAAVNPVWFAVYDVTDPDRPREVARIQAGDLQARHDAMGIAVAGSYAYVALGSGGLAVVDIRDPEQPRKIGWVNTPGRAVRVELGQDATALVADDTGGVRIFDVSDPAFPTEVRYLPASSTRDLRLSGDNLWVVHGAAEAATFSMPWEGLGSYDVAACLEHPRPSGEIALETGQAIDVSSGIAYVADRELPGLRIIDVGDPAAPRLRSTFSDPTIPSYVDVEVVDDVVFLAGHLDGLVLLDVSDPDSPRELGRYDSAGTMMDIVEENGFAYVADGPEGLLILDVSDPSAPARIAGNVTSDFASGVALRAGHALVAAGRAGLVVIDVENPKAPRVVGSVDGLDASRVVAKGDHAYVVTQDGALSVVDVSSPARPRELAFLRSSRPPGAHASDIELWGHYVIVTRTFGGLWVVDVTDPANPREVWYLDSDTHFAAFRQSPIVDGRVHAVRTTVDSGNALVLYEAAPWLGDRLSSGDRARGVLPTGSVQKPVWRYYYAEVPPGQDTLEITLTDLTGDADLYVAFGDAPDADRFECRSMRAGTAEERCVREQPAAGRWWFGLRSTEPAVHYGIVTSWERRSGRSVP